MKHLISLVSALWLLLGLSIGLVPLTVFVLVKLLPWQAAKAFAYRGMELCYRAAVRANSFWMLRVIGIQVEVTGQLPDHPSPIIIANHQTWFDIAIVQHLIVSHGTIAKFLMKRELLWVPVVGWVCYAMNFPRLNRGQGTDARQRDYGAIQQVSKTLADERGALLIFPEGTRFTPKKHKAQAAPYTHLLNPKPGGLKIALATAPPNTPVADITLIYEGDTNFWRCLHGATKKIHAKIQVFDSIPPEAVNEWLTSHWHQKDALWDERPAP